jgi:hypothetical protein
MADRQLLLADVAHRKTLTSGKPRLGYIGALGDGNLGDEAMFTAAQLLYPEHQLVTLLSSWREAELASKGLSGPDFFKGVILGGGTLISPYWHPAIAHAEKDNGNLHTIVIGSHPDDAQSTSVGAAAMWEWLGQRRCTNVRRSL